jgi:hypothetical protein
MIRCCTALGFPALTTATLRFHASAQCIHQIDDFHWPTLFRCFDLLTSLLLTLVFRHHEDRTPAHG